MVQSSSQASQPKKELKQRICCQQWSKKDYVGNLEHEHDYKITDRMDVTNIIQIPDSKFKWLVMLYNTLQHWRGSKPKIIKSVLIALHIPLMMQALV